MIHNTRTLKNKNISYKSHNLIERRGSTWNLQKNTRMFSWYTTGQDRNLSRLDSEHKQKLPPHCVFAEILSLRVVWPWTSTEKEMRNADIGCRFLDFNQIDLTNHQMTIEQIPSTTKMYHSQPQHHFRHHRRLVLANERRSRLVVIPCFQWEAHF